MKKIKNLLVLCSAFFLLISLVKPINALTLKFSDVPTNHTYYQYVTTVANSGLVNGYGDGRFGPDDKITRGQIAVMLVNALNLKLIDQETGFSDVPRTHPFAKHINAAVKSGILNGYRNGKFGVNDFATRAQLSIMITNAFNIKINPAKIKQFPDLAISNEAYNYIQALVSNGIVSGYANGNFGVYDSVTRGQFTVFLYKAMPSPKAPLAPIPNPKTTGELNALQTASQYLDFSAFSYKGLIEQLRYEKYTDQEAIFAVNNIGADWYYQAFLSAKSYLKISSFSRQGLIDQLMYEGFSEDQAIQAVNRVGL